MSLSGRIRTLLVLLALALAAPASALAQNAGDNEYQDPFSNQGGSGGGGSGSTGGSTGGSSTQPGAAPAQAAPAAQAPVATSAQLPRTGAPPAWLLAGTGALMLGGGVQARRLARERD